MWFSAYHGDGNATLRFKPARIRNYLLVGPGIFAVPAKGRRATKWWKGPDSNPEFHHESAVRSMMTPVRRAKPSDSEIGTQMMERTLQTPLAPASPHGDALLHSTANRLIFYTKISKIVPRRLAFYVRHRRRGRQMQGGWRES